jgi:hypothetical protein
MNILMRLNMCKNFVKYFYPLHTSFLPERVRKQLVSDRVAVVIDCVPSGESRLFFLHHAPSSPQPLQACYIDALAFGHFARRLCVSAPLRCSASLARSTISTGASEFRFSASSVGTSTVPQLRSPFGWTLVAIVAHLVKYLRQDMLQKAP